MTRLKSKITNPKSQINSEIQITKTQKSLPSPGACLREAASAKAGARGGGWFDKLTITTLNLSKGHPHLYPVE